MADRLSRHRLGWVVVFRGGGCFGFARGGDGVGFGWASWLWNVSSVCWRISLPQGLRQGLLLSLRSPEVAGGICACCGKDIQ